MKTRRPAPARLSAGGGGTGEFAAGAGIGGTAPLSEGFSVGAAAV